MKNDPPVNNLSKIGASRYPHIKLTNEVFPRALATRRIENDGDEYFGAFLPKTAARILIDFLNRTFRLRSCDIPIDGSFPVPCTQYFRRRCVAPCVKSICSQVEYLPIVEIARLFLANRREQLVAHLERIISEFSKHEDFESAARYRDMMIAIDRFWNEPRWKVWLDDAVDTIAVQEAEDAFNIFLVTHRGRKVLGRKVFVARTKDFTTAESALSYLIETFYAVHLPKEIRIDRKIANRRELEEALSQRFGRQARITVSDPAKKGVNVFRGLDLSHAEHTLDQARPTAAWRVIAMEIARMFALRNPPFRIEAFDAAHISGTGMVAARAVWKGGEYFSPDYDFSFHEGHSELNALASAVRARLVENSNHPDLILIDGGANHLNKVLSATADIKKRPPIIAAVKPRGKHLSIAAFLSETRSPTPFDVDSPAHAMLQLLRDEAHDLANRVHRDYREMLPFYEAKGFDRPLVVPLRFHAVNGAAEDLIPINSK
jgi:excinuclease ABC subunit C